MVCIPFIENLGGARMCGDHTGADPIAKWKANGNPGDCHLHSVHKEWGSTAPVTKPVWAWRPLLSHQGGEMAGTH